MTSRVCGYLTLIGGFFFHLSLGYFYTVGNMNPYLMAYMNITSGQSVWFNAMQLSTQAITMPIGGFLHSKFGFRIPVFLGACFSSGGIYLSRLTIDYGLGPFICTYSLMLGCGIGLSYSVILSVASSWFPNRRAFVVGFITSGFGLGALVFIPFAIVFIPLSIVSPDILKRIPNSFLVLASIMTGLEIVGLIVSRENKEDFYDNSGLTTECNAAKEKNSVVRNVTVKDALKCPNFYLLWCIFFCNTVLLILQSSTIKTYGKENIQDDRYLSAVATTGAVFNCIGRLAWGLVCDRFSFKFPMCVFLLSWAVTFSIFPFIGVTGHFKIFYPISVASMFFCLAGNFVLVPSATNLIFGPQKLSTLYGLLFTSTLPSALGLSAIVSQYDLRGHWDVVYLSCAAVCLVSFCLSLFLKDERGSCRVTCHRCTGFCDSRSDETPDDYDVDDAVDAYDVIEIDDGFVKD